jgi:hypothetical protein
MTIGLYLGVLLAIGLGLLGFGAWLVWRGRALGIASTTWPIARGTVKSSRVVPHDADGIDLFIAEVTYEYKVGVKTYVGDRLRFGAYAGTLGKAQQDVDKYRAGMPVDVHYAPRQPQTSTLEPGVTGISAAGLALAAGGAALIALTIAVSIFV